MIVALLLFALVQDGPVRTAPTAVPAPQEGPAVPADPAAHCTFGGRPVSGPGCPPVVRRRLVTGAPASGTDGSVPAWALDDPAGWEASQCGTPGDDACRRQARNRLAMARAGVAAEAPAEASGGGATAQNCRMVMRRSENGFGGSLSRICGDEADTEATLNRLEDSMRPAVEPCDRPATMETQEAWIARCRALPPR